MAKVQTGTVKLRLDNPDVEQHLHFDFFDKDDSKKACFSVDFAEPFDAPPAVRTSISGANTSTAAPGANGGSHELHFAVSCASANAKGFDLMLEVRRNNSLYSVDVSWIAIEKG